MVKTNLRLGVVNIKVNDLLQTTLRAYLTLVRSKKDTSAQSVLQMGSAMALMMIDANGLRAFESKVYCPTCRKQLVKGKEIEFAKRVGECTACDHVRNWED